MPIIEHYKNNSTLRAVYIRMNRIKHVEAWDSDCNEGYYVALCSDLGIGIPEKTRVFPTIAAVVAWKKEFVPELPFVNND